VDGLILAKLKVFGEPPGLDQRLGVGGVAHPASPPDTVLA
jgi:hypothetical protein